MKQFDFAPTGVCCRSMKITLENDTLQEVQFVGGCSGNLQGIAALVKGMTIQEVQERLRGIRCGVRPTSCPDQLAQALAQIEAHQ